MGVGQLSESDAVDALRLPFYSSSHPTGSHGWRNQFDLGNPDLMYRQAKSRQDLNHITRRWRTIAMPFYERGSIRIYYEEVGSGFPC